jgi:hypothetical protein
VVPFAHAEDIEVGLFRVAPAQELPLLVEEVDLLELQLLTALLVGGFNLGKRSCGKEVFNLSKVPLALLNEHSQHLLEVGKETPIGHDDLISTPEDDPLEKITFEEEPGTVLLLLFKAGNSPPQCSPGGVGHDISTRHGWPSQNGPFFFFEKNYSK